MDLRDHRSQEKGGVLRSLMVLLGLYLAGFGAYIYSLPNVNAGSTAMPPVHADAIVALTGGDARLETGVALLESGAGQRLLISGVHPETTKEALKHRLHGGPRFDCCADLGFTATDTHGNAHETAEWAHSHGYKSLIVVTAAYHMPRSLLEFGSEMPDVRLVPFPVEIDVVDPSSGWNLETLRILNGEYVKYVASLARITLERAGGAQPGNSS
jgi:uncharacterized SAM-binding protein YcdF (DUF218 family)